MAGQTIFSKPVEVIAVNRAVEAVTGESIYQVIFGEVVGLTPEMRQHFPQPVGSMPPREIGANVLILFFKSEVAAPYKVGSKWKVKVSPDGGVIVEARET